MANNINTNPKRVISGTGQNLTLGAASVSSTAFGSQTYAIRVSATGNCHVEFGMSPVAVATSALIKASDPPAYFAVGPGTKIAVIQDSTSTGTLNVVEITN